MNDNYLGMAEGVREFLSDLGLEQYYEMFLTKGFDSESDMGNITEADLDCLGVRDIAHRQLLLTAAFHYSPSEEHRLYEWLRLHQLDYYHVNFVRSELLDMTAIMRLNLPDEGLYDELEILLPGHRRRLESAVKELRKRRRLEQPSPEEPLAVGRWGKPAALVDAKYDFLCVQAVIASTKNAGNTRKMDFMVDSGSDVVTLREEILESLELELLGTVRSKGVHASREKPLYRARLSIGNSHIEIEVMPESYDSLGSRVIRHFRHFIDGNKHVWLPGNYTEVPLPSYEVASLQEARICGDPELPSQIGVEQESPVTEQVGEVGQASNTLESEEQSASTICPDPKAESGNESNLTASPTVQTLSRICGSTTTKTSPVEGISRAMPTMQSVSCKDCSLMLPQISCNSMSPCNPSDHTSCDVISPPNLSNCSNVPALCQCAMPDISRSGCFTNRNADNGREESHLCQHKDHGSCCSFRCCPESQVSDVVPTEMFAKHKTPKKILSHTTVTCPSIQSTSAKDFPRPLKRISPTDDSCTPAKRTCSLPSNHEGFSTLLSSGVSGNSRKYLFRNEIDSKQNCSPFVDESGCQNYSNLLNSEKIK